MKLWKVLPVRLHAAWHVLRGKPTIYRFAAREKLIVHGDDNRDLLVAGCTFTEGAEG